MNSRCGAEEGTDDERYRIRDNCETYDRSGRRRRGLPSYPTSTTIPRKGICFSVNVLPLPVVFVDPLLVLQRGGDCASWLMMSDPTARRRILSHVIRKFFLSMGRIPVVGCMRRMANKFKVFG